MACDSL
jgi:hypothetical protein